MSGVREPADAPVSAAVRERPLVLPPLSVHSILRGGARRVAVPFSPQPKRVEFDGGGAYLTWRPRRKRALDSIHSRWPEALLEFAPFTTGDLLWVKETWAAIWPAWSEDGLAYDGENDHYGRPLRLEELDIEYRADSLALYPGGWPEEEARGNPEAPKWRSPLHMPREVSRLLLRVKRVHAQQVQQVTESGALTEGVATGWQQGRGQRYVPFPAQAPKAWQKPYRRAKEAYEARWQELYGRKAPWESNPWVWRVDFDVVEEERS